MSSGASSVNKNVESRSADISYDAEGNMLNQSGSGFGASAANFGAPGATVDPTLGSSSAYNSSSTSSYSSSSLGHDHNLDHKHKHHHHHGLSSSSLFSSSTSSLGNTYDNSYSSSSYGNYGSSSLSSGSSSLYGSTYGSSGSLSSSSSSAYGNNYSQDNAMTRSEEQLLVGKERVETGEAALRKTITSEYVSTSVPLIREKVVLEREPITEANRSAAYSGPDLSEAEHIVTVSEERPIVEKEVVAKERVRLGKVAEVTIQTVGGEIRKERIEFDQGTAPLASDSATLSATDAGLNASSDLYNKDRGNTYSSDLARKEAANY